MPTRLFQVSSSLTHPPCSSRIVRIEPCGSQRAELNGQKWIGLGMLRNVYFVFCSPNPCDAIQARLGASREDRMTNA
jgi:hypothetical protein